jgi:hypothetical protein
MASKVKELMTRKGEDPSLQILCAAVCEQVIPRDVRHG